MLIKFMSVLMILILANLTYASDQKKTNEKSIDKPIQSSFTFVYPNIIKQLHTIKIPTHIDEQGLEELYHRYYEHYSDFLGPTPKREVTYDWLMDEKNAQISFELDYLFSLALERKLDVSRFSKFGLNTKPNGDIRYDYRKSKHLIPIVNLHNMLLYPDIYDAWLIKLLDMGLTPSELELIKSYGRTITQNKKLTSTINSLLSQYQASIADSMEYAVKHKHTLKPEKFHDLLNREKFAKAYIHHTIKHHAGIQLFRQFTQKQQRILKVYLIEHNRRVGSRSEPDYEQQLIKRINAIESGQWYKQLQLRLQNYKELEVW